MNIWWIRVLIGMRNNLTVIYHYFSSSFIEIALFSELNIFIEAISRWLIEIEMYFYQSFIYHLERDHLWNESRREPK